MPDWTAFGAVAGLVLLLVLGLARVTTATVASGGDRDDDGVRGARSVGESDDRESSQQRRVERRRPIDREPIQQEQTERESVQQGSTDRERRERAVAAPDPETAAASTADGGAVGDATAVGGDGGARASSTEDRDGVRQASSESAGRHDASGGPGAELHSISTPALLANVLATHGALAAVLVGAAALTEIPGAALGVAPAAWSTGGPAVVGGLALGGALALVNGALAANLHRFGIDYSDALRTALAPDSAVGWAVLLSVALPLVSLFEELLFRGVLVGAAAAATGLSPWPFVVLSSIAFAMGHGLQGRGGILVTGSLGGVLAAAFVLTESLLLVIVAHYVVNAAEFLLHEWLGVDVHERLGV